MARPRHAPQTHRISLHRSAAQAVAPTDQVTVTGISCLVFNRRPAAKSTEVDIWVTDTCMTHGHMVIPAHVGAQSYLTLHPGRGQTVWRVCSQHAPLTRSAHFALPQCWQAAQAWW